MTAVKMWPRSVIGAPATASHALPTAVKKQATYQEIPEHC